MADHYEGQTGCSNEASIPPEKAQEMFFKGFTYGSIRPFTDALEQRTADFMTYIAYTCEQLIPVMDTELFSWSFIELMRDIGADISILPVADYQPYANEFVIFSTDEDFGTIDNTKYTGGIVDSTGTYTTFTFSGISHELPTEGYACTIRY
nr:MAG TPA: hypothetical protein [Caudoviricetes sp.]